jgi:hypothetical protein
MINIYHTFHLLGGLALNSIPQYIVVKIQQQCIGMMIIDGTGGRSSYEQCATSSMHHQSLLRRRQSMAAPRAMTTMLRNVVAGVHEYASMDP